MKRCGRTLLSLLTSLFLLFVGASGLAEENHSRTIAFTDPVFQVDGEDVLALEGLSFTVSRLGGDVYLRLDAGDARVAMGAGRRDGQILVFMDGLDGLYALPVDASLFPWDVQSFSSAQYWTDLLDAWMQSLQKGVVQMVQEEIMGEIHLARQYEVSMSGQELEALLQGLVPAELRDLPGAVGTLAVSEDNAFLMRLEWENGLRIDSQGMRGTADSVFVLTASQDGEELGVVDLSVMGNDVSLKGTWGGASISLEIEETSGAQTSRVGAVAGDMRLTATGLRTEDCAQWRVELTGDDGENAFALAAFYDAEIASLEGGGARETGAFSLEANGFSATFSLEASAVPADGAAGFLANLDQPIVRVDEMTEAERTALAARVQALFLNFAAGAIQNVPGLTEFATMLAGPVSDLGAARELADVFVEEVH